MLFDFICGLILAVVGKAAGLFWWQYLTVFIAAFSLDGDIILNEFVRWHRGEKKKILTLDEYSYTHKFIGHLPLIVIPCGFLAGILIEGLLLGTLLPVAVFIHLLHDTLDKNFDGVRWAYPFNSISYKLRWKNRKPVIESKTADQLAGEAHVLAEKARSSEKILKDNLFLCL